MITVKIDEDDFLDMLMERLGHWTDDDTETKLFESMYRDEIDDGCFDGWELDVKALVDNDYVNYCSVICEGDDLFEECEEAWENDEREVSGRCYIEAHEDGAYLVRW